ncbi:YIP1 family protein [Oceanomicrobium pacificus]|uniref:Yip1 domain-containing protein n=1 Tax=Oceanomicrobium pacificus TaxID=2692916 RepID=A0A6B0TXY1_9RHOB|nr:YIP1 family protein [Oceanomicrobium pacificus]MXU65863.1 hypothetical protein [Oceanomicrobium pacificus]
MSTEEFSTTTGVYQSSRSNLAERVLDAWKDMRRSTRRLIAEQPSEARLLFYVMLSDIVFFLSWSIKTAVAPTEGASDKIPAEIGLWLIAALFVRTAVMYLFSGAVWLSLKLFGGKGSWKDTRAGLFWGAVVSAPFGLLAAIVTVMMSLFEPSFPVLKEPWVALPPYWIGLIPFTWFISAGVAEANGFRSVSLIFMSMSVLAIVAVVMGMYLRATGVI